MRNFRKLITSLSLALLLVLGATTSLIGQQPAPAGSPAATQFVDSDAAQQLFATRCAGCHGLDGKGGERAPDIATQPKIRQLSDLQLFTTLQKGVPQTSMPAFSYLGDDALRSLVGHLRALQGTRTSTALPGDANRGKELFYGKADCSRCHMMRGEGGFFASDLSHYGSGRSAAIIHDAIVSPNKDLPPRQRTVVATLGNGQSLQGITLNEDNFSIQILTQDGALHLLSKAALANLIYRNESPMPADYGTRLSPSEIDDLVKFLFSLTEKETKANQKHQEEEED
jgi:putative heme-binding domain-containing protein